MHGEYKAPRGKLVVTDLEVDQDTLVDATLSSDSSLDPDSVLARTTQALEGVCASASAKEIAKLVETSLESNDVLMGITSAAVGAAVRHVLGYVLSWEDIDFRATHGPVIDPVVNVASDETLVEDVITGRRKPFMQL